MGLTFGSFFLGGRAVTISGRKPITAKQTDTVTFTHDPNGEYLVEQAYVQWFHSGKGGPRVILQHGGGLSGAIWEMTPDGRPGWLHNLLDLGCDVYVIDNVERGRAGWCPFPEVWPGAAVSRPAEEAWSLFRIGPPEDFKARKAFPGQDFPVDHFDELKRFQFPRWLRDTGLAVARLAELIERVGPCVMIGHSQGGEIAARATVAAADSVQALILLEPSGFVVAGDEAKIAAIPTLFVMGDFLERHPIFSALRQAMEAWMQTLQAGGGAPALWNLPGGSHMLMHDRRSQRTARRIVDWVKRMTKS